MEPDGRGYDSHVMSEAVIAYLLCLFQIGLLMQDNPKMTAMVENDIESGFFLSILWIFKCFKL